MVCGAVILAGVARSSAAQRVVRGSVADSTTETPVAGAVVIFLDGNGSSVARTVTSATGEFSVSAQAIARLRIVRIGFRPRDVTISDADGDRPLRITMTRIPSLLDAVRVTGRELCPTSTDRGDAFTLWEQVRAGLLATIVAREANPAIATTLTYTRREAPTDRLVQQQAMNVRTGSTSRPFVAAESAKQFATNGYMTFDESGHMLYAPDADVLVDESFAATHCLRMQRADDAHRGQIGLAFSPVPRRDSAVDVAGVIWVDEAQPALRSLDFRHTMRDPAWVRAPGGHIEFRTAPNGTSFIERWFIEIPIVRVQPGVAGSFQPGRMTSSRPDHVSVDVMLVSGGSVLSARWHDGSSWSDAPAGISGTVVEKGSTRPVAGALVSLDGTADTVTSDSAGRFTIAPVVPGKYRLRVADTTLDAYARDRSESRVVDVARNQTLELRSQLSPISETIADVCKNAGSVFRAVLVGQVLDRDSTANMGSVRATWRVNVGGQGLDLNRDSRVDAHGRFLLCGLPSGIRVHLKWLAGALQADTTTVLERGPVSRFDWRVSPAASLPNP